MLFRSTPIEVYEVGNRLVYVKREDLACVNGGPPFAKMRGMDRGLEQLKEQGVKTITYRNKFYSMAGWGLSWLADHYGMSAYITENPDDPVPEGPGYAEIAKGLTYPEVVDAVAEETTTVPRQLLAGSIVLCAGTATMLKGIKEGCERLGANPTFHIVLVDSCRAGTIDLPGMSEWARIYDPGYKGEDQVLCDCPFPCNSYYDRKAWKHLTENTRDLEDPVLFWNIGAESDSREERKWGSSK